MQGYRITAKPILTNDTGLPTSGESTDTNKNNARMGRKERSIMDLKEIAQALGLGEDASEEEILTACKAAAKAVAQLAEERAQNEEDNKAALSAAVKTAVAEAVKPIEEKVAALSAAAVAHEKADLIAEAAREGKVIALGADAIGKITVDDLKATIAKTPATVPLNAKTPANMKENPPAGEVPEEFRKIALNCGVDPEIFKAGK
ncbi:MAG: hypothetical protein IKO72_00560 [Kiritimatiellae bacterium]|nr:hypothetical protein [Kiritimatiellia bacterium]